MQAMLALNWEPQIRGILIIIIAVSVLCGSVYLILGTNLGARLGFLLSLSALAGWMMLMAIVWWAFGIGLFHERGVGGRQLGVVLEDARFLQRNGCLQDGLALDRLPRGDVTLQAEAERPPDDAHEHHPAGEGRQRQQEPESGTDVGGEDQVHGAAQHRHRDDDDEDAAELWLPVDGKQR